MHVDVGIGARKFLILLWKNIYVLRKRHWLITALDVLLPIVLFCLLVAILPLVIYSRENVVDEPTRFREVSEEEIISSFYNKGPFVFAPTNQFTIQIMTRTVEKFGSNYSALRAMSSENAVIEYYEELTINSSNSSPYGFIAVIFEGEAAQPDVELPNNLQYKLRFNPSKYFRTDLLMKLSNAGPVTYVDTYLWSGFSAVQVLLDKSFIELVRAMETGNPITELPDKMFQQKMPYPPYVSDYDYGVILRLTLPPVAAFSLITLCVSVLKRVVEERDTGVTELMRLMGMRSWAMWCSWMVDQMVLRVFSIALIVVLLVVPFSQPFGAVIQHSDGSLIYFMLLLYCVAAITSCFLLSSFFSKPMLAMGMGIILWLVSIFVPMAVVELLSLTLDVKMVLMLLPNMSLYYIFAIISDFETKGIGAQWWNFLDNGTGDPNEPSLGHVTLMLVLDVVLDVLITWYVSAVWPGKFGVPKPWYFLFTRAYWQPETSRKPNNNQGNYPEVTNFERPLSKGFGDSEIGVHIRCLTKTFSGSVRAVQGLSLDLYKGEMTALLGHNGAGKTTTMSILTGMIEASGGTVNILGHDLNTELTAVRSSLGLCPQHNMLFNDLTVQEHLLFFAMLKGNSYQAARKEAEDLAQRVRLRDKWNQLASTLSGGMKRKLSLAIALIGGSKVLMLDEPTSGMDPEARREVWDILLGMRGERTILFSTHYMEEADVLGDTIAIMSQGRVHCCGSSLYLKRLYGAGYHLTLMRGPRCDIDLVAREVCAAVPQAELTATRTHLPASSATPLTFILPAEQIHLFADMFDRLERSRDQLDITGVGVAVTTMEEVFIKAGEQADMKSEEMVNGGSRRNGQDNTIQHLEGLEGRWNVGWRLWLQRFLALVTKKWLVTRKRWLTMLFQIAILLIIMTVTIVVCSLVIDPQQHSEPLLTMSLADYGTADQLNVLYSASEFSSSQQAAQEYANLFSGLATVRQIPLSDGGVQEGLLQAGMTNEALYRQYFIVAASFNGSDDQEGLNVTALDSSLAYHGTPTAINLASNALLRTYTADKRSITIANHPLPQDSNSYYYVYNAEGAIFGVQIIWYTLAPLGWMFVVAMTMVLPLQERICGARHIQVMAGCSHVSVWLSYFVVDVIVNTLLAILTVVIIIPTDTTSTFNQPEEIGVLFLIMFLYGMSGTAFSYFFSFYKKSSAGSYAVVIVINLIVGTLANMTISFLEMGGLEKLKAEAEAFRWTFGLFMPHAAFGSALHHFAGTATYNAQCRNMPADVKEFLCNQGEDLDSRFTACCEEICGATDSCFSPVPYLAWYGNPEGSSDSERSGPVGREVLFLTLGVPLWLALVLLLDSGLMARAKEFLARLIARSRQHPDDLQAPARLDEDVMAERARVSQIFHNVGDEPSVLAVQELAKSFGWALRRPRVAAVRGLSFAVAPGECFGLLGVNGAGKTTTFRMVTGAEAATGGYTAVLGARLQGERGRYLRDLGYCPQFDAQIGVLTGRETLSLYANLRGIPRNQIGAEINKWFDLLGLTEYGSRQSGTYSGGNKRKLSAAMALIGDPPLVLLDEPTSGVDPSARRRLWRVLEQSQRAGQAIVLTSHSMDECEALCGRLGIMVDGQLVCVGTTSHLKHKFCQGFALVVKLRAAAESEPSMARLKRDIVTRLAPCELRDQHQGVLSYHVTDPTVSWSTLFSTLEDLKVKHAELLEDYTLSETTLEQVFLAFARAKHDHYEATTKL